MFGFGVEKFWCPKDAQTKNASYIKYFLFWQPMPSPAAWAMHQLPLIIHKLSFYALFVTEIVMPFCIFMPYPFPLLAAISFAGLQFGIQICGNYGTFNILTATMTIPLLDYQTSLKQALILSYDGTTPTPSQQKNNIMLLISLVCSGGQLNGETLGIYVVALFLSACGCCFLVRQLRPGGVYWANYPAWVFSDKSKVGG